MSSSKVIAFDLDNTIIEYGNLFNIALKEEGIDLNFPDKISLQNYLSTLSNGNEIWIKIQGRVYGQYLHRLPPPQSFIKALKNLTNHKLLIVSHKSTISLCGKYYLREEALKYLSQHKIDILFDEIHFFETKNEKIDWINSHQVDFLVDDLKEILDSVKNTLKVHYKGQFLSPYLTIHYWDELISIINNVTEKNILKISPRAFLSEFYVYKNFVNFRDRFEREHFFLSHLRKNNFFTFPHLVKSEFPLVKTSIESDVKRLEYITEDFCNHYFAFIKEVTILNTPFKATHHILSVDHYKDVIETRIQDIYFEKFKKLPLLIDQVFAKVQSSKKLNGYITFPDFCKNNFSYVNNKLFITDFESVGEDAPSKTFLNALHHMGHSINENEINILYKAFENFYGRDFSENIHLLIDLNALDWILIGIKRFFDTNSDSLHEQIDHKINFMFNEAQKGEIYWSWKKHLLSFLNE